MDKKYRRILAFLMIFPLTALACGFSINTPQLPTVPPVATVVVVATPASPLIAQPSLVTNEDAVLTELYNRVNPSVVNITTFSEDRNTIFSSGQGSGFVYDLDGHIVTNSHVVHGSAAIEVGFSDGETLAAEIIGQDLHSDLAVIKVESLPAGVQPLTLADINTIAVGQTVVAIGNPFGLGGTLTRGIVSALGRTIPALTSFSIPQAIQTDAPINPGNSGGPLLNLYGEVIGVNAQIETDGTSRTNSGIGYAIPVSIVQRVAPELIANGEFVWGWLGVRGGNVTPTQVKAMDLSVNKGAYISEVIDNGPSDKAGLRGSRQQTTIDGRIAEIGGDIIIAVEGQPVSSFDDILIYIALNTSPGQTIELTILRDNQTQQIQVTLEPRPSEVMTLP
jgi:2-alkenal reductase